MQHLSQVEAPIIVLLPLGVMFRLQEWGCLSDRQCACAAAGKVGGGPNATHSL